MLDEEIQKLNKIFAHDVTICSRCQGECTIATAINELFGEHFYTECPKCKGAGIFPWGAFLIYSEKLEILMEQIERE